MKQLRLVPRIIQTFRAGCIFVLPPLVSFAPIVSGISQEPSSQIFDVTAKDIATALRLNLIKLKIDRIGDAKTGGILAYWVESLDSDGSKNIHDHTQIGVANGNCEILFRLPGETDRLFGVFGKVNSRYRTSRLGADTEDLGAVAWLYPSEPDLPPQQETIIAIRTFGVTSISEGRTLEETLETLMQGPYRRIDVFKVLISPVQR